MSDYKGVGVLFVRTQAREKSSDVESALLARLPEKDVERYRTMVATEWVSIEFANRLYEAAAPLLYPGKPNPLRMLGRDLALDNLKGVYRFLARILTIPYLIEQSFLLWRTYHRNGTISIVQRSSKEVDFVVKNYQRLPEGVRECLTGFLAGAVEIAGGRNVSVVLLDDDASAWKWNLRWS